MCAQKLFENAFETKLKFPAFFAFRALFEFFVRAALMRIILVTLEHTAR